mmetsp:Transcript_62462/g.167249  ORF Transcript_62462/g.167249 Transcript_62462/m.167249 type:complete len:106 (+) Transcript_62462:65-382(+)
MLVKRANAGEACVLAERVSSAPELAVRLWYLEFPHLREKARGASGYSVVVRMRLMRSQPKVLRGASFQTICTLTIRSVFSHCAVGVLLYAVCGFSPVRWGVLRET